MVVMQTLKSLGLAVLLVVGFATESYAKDREGKPGRTIGGGTRSTGAIVVTPHFAVMGD